MRPRSVAVLPCLLFLCLFGIPEYSTPNGAYGAIPGLFPPEASSPPMLEGAGFSLLPLLSTTTSSATLRVKPEETATIDSLLRSFGQPAVPAVIEQPALPLELRPQAVPQPRSKKLTKAPRTVAEPPLLAKNHGPLPRTQKPRRLLPGPDAEPGVVYVVPFRTLMVPPAVRERIFDQFVDLLNQQSSLLQLKFVILKQDLEQIDPAWLETRKYVLGEIYNYVEESGCCSTEVRSQVRMRFFRAHRPDPSMEYEMPSRIFFDHDQSTLAMEREKLADRVVEALVDELLKNLSS